MRTTNEGFNTFSGYDSCVFYLDFVNRKSTTTTVQMKFGGEAECESENIKSEVRKYYSQIRQFFYRKTRDGYYNDKFIFIPGNNENLIRVGKGLFFNEIFFFLEEEYEKKFVIEYFITLFNEIEQINKNNKEIKFSKYGAKQKKRRQERAQ